MNVESNANVKPLILPFFTKHSNGFINNTRKSFRSYTLLLNLDSTAMPYGGSEASMSHIRLSLGSFHSCLTSIRSLGICLNLLSRCALKTPIGLLGGLPGEPLGWKDSLSTFSAKDRSTLRNRVSRVSYLFMVHLQKSDTRLDLLPFKT